jgi:ATPase subunit of ABC transporter with duplicated ATPase domains
MATVKKVKKAQFGAPIKKGGYRGGCAATTSGADRAERKEARVAERDYKKAVRVAGREERQAERAEKKAAKSAPAAKHGMKVKKAQSGKMVPSEMKPGKMIKKADRDARATKMADALDKQAGKGSSARPMGANLDKKSFDKVPSLDKLKKKIEKKKDGGTVSMQLGSYDRQLGKNYTGKKVVNKGAKAKMGKSVGKCKYGC